MAKHIFIQLKGGKEPVRVPGTKVVEKGEKVEGLLSIEQDNGTQVGSFRQSEVAGWWIEEDENSSPSV